MSVLDKPVWMQVQGFIQQARANKPKGQSRDQN